eukprot:7084102-Heterocapsa_arctica.AAC.1
MFSIMNKYNILIRKGAENTEEGIRLKQLTLNCDVNDISKQEMIVDKLKGNIQTERTHRWRSWVENSWAHKKQYIYMD